MIGRYVRSFAIYVIILLCGLVLFEVMANIFFATNGKVIIPKRRIIFVPDEELSYVLKPGFKVSGRDNNLYPGVSIRTNALGLRDVESDKWLKNRILAVGDSNTFGYGIDVEDTFPKQLESLIRSECENDVSVINGGIPGYNVWQEVRLIRRYLSLIGPDVVIQALYVNDIEPVYVPKLGGQTVIRLPFYPWEEWKVDTFTEWVSTWHLFTPVVVNRIIMKVSGDYTRPIVQVFKGKRTINTRNNPERKGQKPEKQYEEYDKKLENQLEYLSSDQEKVRIRWKEAEKTLREVSRVLKQRHIYYIILLLPFRNQLANSNASRRIQEDIRGFCELENIDFIDALPVLEKYESQKLFLDSDYHCNRLGNKIISSHVYNYLVSKNIVCRKKGR